MSERGDGTMSEHSRDSCVLIMSAFRVGDPAPEEYLQWHEWAKVQYRGRLRQRRCWKCGLYRFPQEQCCGPAPKFQPLGEREGR